MSIAALSVSANSVSEEAESPMYASAGKIPEALVTSTSVAGLRESSTGSLSYGQNSRLGKTLAAPLLIGLLAILPADSVHAAPEKAPVRLSGELPFDVNVKEVRTLVGQGKVIDAQRAFDVLAWQAFVALNWPANAKGEPDPFTP